MIEKGIVSYGHSDAHAAIRRAVQNLEDIVIKVCLEQTDISFDDDGDIVVSLPLNLTADTITITLESVVESTVFGLPATERSRAACRTIAARLHDAAEQFAALAESAVLA